MFVLITEEARELSASEASQEGLIQEQITPDSLLRPIVALAEIEKSNLLPIEITQVLLELPDASRSVQELQQRQAASETEQQWEDLPTEVAQPEEPVTLDWTTLLLKVKTVESLKKEVRKLYHSHFVGVPRPEHRQHAQRGESGSR